MLAGSLALYAAGVALGWPELVGLGAAGLAALAIAALFVVVRPTVRFERSVEPDRVTGGSPTVARLDVAARGRLPSRAVVVVDRLAGVDVEVPVPALPPGARRTVRYPLATPRRGRLALGPLRVERRDPLGLVRRSQPLGGQGVLWVRPRTHPLPVLPAGSLLDQEGPQLEISPRGTVTFSSLREYVPGDDPRLVHWRSTARTGQLMVREHVDTSQPTTTVIVDTRRIAWPQDPETGLDEACEVAASVVAAGRAAGRPVTLHAVGENVADAIAAGARDLPDRLAGLRVSDQQDPDSLAALAERAVPGGALVVVTGALPPTGAVRLAALARRFTPVVLVQLEPHAATRADRAAGLTVVRAANAVAAAAAWRALLRGGRA